MANTLSSKKTIRVGKRRNIINKITKNAFKSARKDLIKSIVTAKPAEIKAQLAKAYSKVDFAVKKGVLKKNTGARLKSRMASKVNSSNTK
ncbi:MAG: 30S ribosomal protein S20 [bacterium]